jgi:hypothetical protein
LGFHLEGMLEEDMPIPTDVLEVDRITVEVANPAAKETTA